MQIKEDQAWIDYHKNFSKNYDNLNYSSGLQSWVMKAGHKAAEMNFGPEKSFSKVLEVGAGTGEHLDFVKHEFDQYFLTDHDAEALEVAKKKIGDRHKDKIVYQQQSGNALNFEDKSFDRLFAGHVLEHIYYPHLALKEWARVLKEGAVLTVLIPTDPGIAWRLGRHLGPRKNAFAQGIAYDYIMAREHVNPCNNLIALLRHYFPDGIEKWWPTPIPSMDLNLFFIYHATIKKQDKK